MQVIYNTKKKMETEVRTQNNNQNRETQIEELRKVISAQYSELDVLDNTLKTISNPQERVSIESQYWAAGITFRGSIVYAFSLLDDLPNEYKDIYNVWNQELIDNPKPFSTLKKARDYRDITRELLKIMVEYTDDIKDEIELQRI